VKLTKAQLAHQAQLRDRELLIGEQHLHRGQEAVFEELALDRQGRWAKLVGNRKEDAWVREWANHMTALFGPRVFVHRTKLDWPTALYVTRYGEAEYYWPDQLAETDRLRARRWATGDTPNGVRYILAEDKV